MRPVITVHSDKGGIGKTTTAAAIADAARKRGFRVLSVDADPQANLSMVQERFVSDGTASTFGLVAHGDEVVPVEGQACVPADREDLADLGDGRLGISPTAMRDRIEEALERGDFDLCVIDTPPAATSFLTISALVASTHVVIPCEPDAFSVAGLVSTLESIEELSQAGFDFDGRVGVLITRFRKVTRLHPQEAEKVAEACANLGVLAFEGRIPEDVRVQAAQGDGLSIFDVPGPKTRAVAAYSWFFDEELAPWVGLGKGGDGR